MKAKMKAIIVASAVVAAGSAAFIADAYNKKKKEKIILPEKFTLTAHTGCEGTADNSLEAITKGFECGADIVEFDINFTSEGVPVLAHDKALDNSVTLDEAFSLIAEYENLRVNVDCKTTQNLKAIVESAEKHGVLDRIFYTGIEEKDVDAVKAQTPDVVYYLNTPVKKSRNRSYLVSLAEKVEALGAVGINMNHKNCSKELVSVFHERGLLVSIWTLNNEPDMLKKLPLGADNITTRHPEKLSELIRAKTSK